MATTKLEFQELAYELFYDEFFDLLVPCTFEKKGTVTNPILNPNPVDIEEIVECLPQEYNANQFDGQNIQVNDFKLLARPQEFTTLTPRTDNLKVTVQGQVCTVISAEQDPANAVWIIQVRG